LRTVEETGTPRVLRILYGLVVGAVALGGLVVIVDWAGRGDELPGGGVPVTGRVVEEQPGFGGALAIVEVAYEAGGKARRARLPIPGSDAHPTEPTYEPGDTIALLVSRTNPERVHHANWDSGATSAPIPIGLVVLGAVAILTPLAFPKARLRLQEAVAGTLRNGGGRGI
jgi:hypothetical protein